LAVPEICRLGNQTENGLITSGVARGGSLGATGPGRHFKGSGTSLTKN